MKAVRLHAFHSQPVVDEVPEPAIAGPLDVIVRIGGAGVCRTDLHIIEGQWDAAMGTPLPYILGHENAGWVHEVGSAVTSVAPGDTVILHPTPTCGLCRACRAGQDMHCINSSFPGLSTDGGMAEYLLTSARACVKLDPSTRPQDVAALADAGITAYHAVRKAIPLLYPGHHLRGHRGRRPRPHRHPVPGRADRHEHHRGRPEPGRAQAGRAARRAAHRGRRREPGAGRAGPDRRRRRRGRARLRGRAGRGERRLGHDRPGRLLLRHRLRRHGAHPDAGHHLHRAQHHRQHRRHLQRAGRADGAGAGRQGDPAHQDLPARPGSRGAR